MNKEIKALKSELALVKLQFSERIRGIEERLDDQMHQDDNYVENPPERHTEKYVQAESKSFTPVYIEEDVQASDKKEFPIHAEQYLAQKQQEAAYPSKPSFILLFFQAIFSSLFDWFAPVTKIYQSYKERGMLGIFTLTIVGISLTLAGFGYLMQLLIDQMGAGTKSLLMAFVAITVIGMGIGLKIKTRFGEFATAIVTLGILLAYSTVYFSGSIYGLLPANAVLLSYLVIAALCHILALKLETKVVAALGIIGIATMPILSNTSDIESLSYLLSLFFVTTSSLILAYRHLGQWLANLSLAFVIIAIEWIININGIDISAWTVDLFYLLFFVYVVLLLLNKVPNQKNDSKPDKNQVLILLATLVGSTVLLFSQANNLFSGQMSFSFMANSAIAGASAIFFYQVRHQYTHYLILVSSLWAVLAIVSAINNAYWGVAWAAEGLLLLYIGRQHLLPTVIHQGQVLTSLALGYSLIALVPYFPLPALKSADGWLLTLVILFVIGIWQRLINFTDAFDQLTTHKIKPLLQFLESFWLSIILIASAVIWLENWTGATAILVQIALLFRAKKCKQVSIEILAATLILVPLLYVYQGATSVSSYRFMTLPLYAQIALISAFVQLWLWAQFYRQYQPDSKIKAIAENTRIVFYMLIPIFWLSSVVRHFDENALMVIWLSPAISLLLALKIKHQLLINETKLLAALASLLLIAIIAQVNLVTGLLALIGFSIFIYIAFSLNKKQTSDKLFESICSWGLISLGFSLPIFIGSQADSSFITVLLTCVVWAGLFNGIARSGHLKRNELFITFTNIFLIGAAWILTVAETSYAIIPCIFILAALYQKESRFKQSILGKATGLHGDLLLHTIAAITYSLLLASLTDYRLDLLMAPTLAVHGALILFMKDKRLVTVKFSFLLILLGITKLALVDAANALLWQKVVLFIGIGVFILVASFWYQKIMNKGLTLNEGK